MIAKRIKKLSNKTISLIAAGEVIHNPFNVVKELVENCLDANATNIFIEVSSDLSYIRIRDDGMGIHQDDIPLICNVHTTSKIEELDDLNELSSLGFRGEALNSICQVAEVTIVSRQRDSLIGYSAKFDAVDNKTSEVLECNPCAANPGTQITVDKLFKRNQLLLPGMELRRNSTDEYRNIIRLINDLAIHHLDINFSLCKRGAKFLDVNAGSMDLKSDCRKHRINSLFSLKKNSFIEIHYDLHLPCIENRHRIDVNALLSIKDGCLRQLPSHPLTSKLPARHIGDQFVFILFINNRLVESNELKKALKDLTNFIYLSLDLPPFLLDVNVHPSKRVVKFLYQDQLISSVVDLIEKQYLERKPYNTMAALNKSFVTDESIQIERANTNGKSPQTTLHVQRNRIDPSQTHLFSVISNSRSLSQNEDYNHISPEWRDCQLVSVKDLRSEIQINWECQKLFKHLIYIGMVYEKRIIVQSHNELLFGSFELLCSEMFYQIIINRFGNLNRIYIESQLDSTKSKGLSLQNILLSVLSKNKKLGKLYKMSSKQNIHDQIQFLICFLHEHSVMLDDYFSIKLTKKDNDMILYSIPDLIPGYTPQLFCIAYFLIRLISEVDWSNEKACFKGISNEIVMLFKYRQTGLNDSIEDYEKAVLNFIFPYIKQNFKPTRTFSDYFSSIVRLPDLYKIFERC